jgi:hypothetical protein
VSPALFVVAAASHKLGPVDYEPYEHASGRTFQRPHPRAPFVCATHVSIRATCPNDCPLKDAGCYAQGGFTRRSMEMLDEAAAERGMSGLDVIRAEVEAIDHSFVRQARRVPRDGARGGRDLRLHVAGDVPTAGGVEAAKLLAGAARRWRLRGGGAVWTYTHQWHRVPRAAWGPISVLASCDQPYEVEIARRRGYAAALVVAAFPSDRAFTVAGVPGKVVPCPAQTGERTCAECRLCLDRDLLRLDVTVGFAAHGASARRIAERSWSPAPKLVPALALLRDRGPRRAPPSPTEPIWRYALRERIGARAAKRNGG